MNEFALFAGSAAAAIFMISQLPMLVKACRTRDLTSYSFANIGLANLGNLLYAVYVFHVPLGPVWAIHGFNVTTSGLMLYWCVRYRRRTSVTAGGVSSGGPRAPADWLARPPRRGSGSATSDSSPSASDAVDPETVR